MKEFVQANISTILPRFVRDNKLFGRTKQSLIYTEGYDVKDEEKDNFLEKYNPDRIIDTWFDKNDIRSLEFKCKTWAKAKRLAHKYIYKQLKELVPCKSILYSRNAGCSCGCSPGFFVNEPELQEHTGVSMWVKGIVVNDEERHEILRKLEQLTKELKEEVSKRRSEEAIVAA